MIFSPTPARTKLIRLSAAAAVPWLAGYAVLYVNEIQRLGLKGVDFIAYYLAAQLVTRHAGPLYDFSVQQAVQNQISAHYWGIDFQLLAFVNPPFVALLLAPLAALNLYGAYLAWSAFNLFACGFAIFLIARASRLTRPESALLTAVGLAFFPVFGIVIQGQGNGLVLLGVALCYWYQQRGRPTLAGAALALALVKPHVILFFPLLLIARKDWRALLGFAAAAVVLVGVSALAFGPQVWADYAQLTLAQASGLHQAWFAGEKTSLTLLGLFKLAGLTTWLRWSLWLLLLGVAFWRTAFNRSAQSWDFAFASALSVAVSPHNNIHDLSLLVISLLLVAAVFLSRRHRSWGAWAAVLAFAVVIQVVALANPYAAMAGVLVWVGFLEFQRSRAGAERGWTTPAKVGFEPAGRALDLAAGPEG